MEIDSKCGFSETVVRTEPYLVTRDAEEERLLLRRGRKLRAQGGRICAGRLQAGDCHADKALNSLSVSALVSGSKLMVMLFPICTL